MSGFDALPHDAWTDIAAALSRPWPAAAAEHDLRWHAAEHGIRRTPLPGLRELADRWGWPGGKNRVAALIRSGSWVDPARPWAWSATPERRELPADGTPPGQSRDTSGTLGRGSTPEIEPERDTSGTPSGHLRDSRADTEDRARITPAPGTPLLGVGKHAADAAPPAADLPTLLNGDHATIAALVAKRVLTVDDLAALTMTQLRLIHGIGPKRAITIRDALVAAGRDLTPEAVVPKRKTVDRPGLRDLTDRWCRAYHHVTGHEYRWTSRGRSSDQAAASTIYDVVGWSETPTPEAEADAGGTIRRYLADCRTRGTVPTLTQLAAQLPQWRQTVNGDRRSDRRQAPRTIFEQVAAEYAANDVPDRVLINPLETA